MAEEYERHNYDKEMREWASQSDSTLTHKPPTAGGQETKISDSVKPVSETSTNRKNISFWG